VPEIGQEEPVPDRWSAAAAPGLWVDEADDPRFTGEDLTDGRSTLVDCLRAYRITLELKCADLDAEQLARRSVPSSTMSLPGLIRHLAQVERNWFRSVLAGLDTPELYTPVNADWDGAVADPAVAAEALGLGFVDGGIGLKAAGTDGGVLPEGPYPCPVQAVESQELAAVLVADSG
jgi:hypothetical protein